MQYGLTVFAMGYMLLDAIYIISYLDSVRDPKASAAAPQNGVSCFETSSLPAASRNIDISIILWLLAKLLTQKY